MYFPGVTGGQAGAITNDSDTAALFDGVAGTVEVPFAAARNSTAFSLECWAKPGTVAATNYMAVVNARVPNSSSAL
jgi:hypothetical protein